MDHGDGSLQRLSLTCSIRKGHFQYRPCIAYCGFIRTTVGPVKRQAGDIRNRRRDMAVQPERSSSSFEYQRDIYQGPCSRIDRNAEPTSFYIFPHLSFCLSFNVTFLPFVLSHCLSPLIFAPSVLALPTPVFHSTEAPCTYDHKRTDVYQSVLH